MRGNAWQSVVRGSVESYAPPMSDDDERRLRLREASYLHSSSREALIEHVFVAEILQEAWSAREQLVDALRSEVDAAGYDIVFECGNILRHVQLKASESGGKTARQTINTRLGEKPGGCVVWVVYRERIADHRLDLSYLWFGGNPGEYLPDLGEQVGRNPRSNAESRNEGRYALPLRAGGLDRRAGGAPLWPAVRGLAVLTA